jgi:hypothetical protein
VAKIHEEVVIIKLSKLVKDNESPELVASDEVVDALASVAEELAGAGVIVEVERA